MAWGNNGDVPYNQNMTDEGNHTLTVNGLATAGGGLNVGAVNNELQITSAANEVRIERLGDVPLFINADAPLESGDVIISHADNVGVSTPTVIIQSQRLVVGNQQDGVGHIDANGVALVGQPLMIGSRDITNQVQIGNSLVPGFLVLLVGSVQVGGPAANPGRINAGADGAGNRNLEIGGQTPTADVLLGRAGKTVRLSAPMNANGNAVSLDAAGTLRVVSNAVGHGWGASGDFVVNGNVVGWYDAAGIHVQPPAPPAP